MKRFEVLSGGAAEQVQRDLVKIGNGDGLVHVYDPGQQSMIVLAVKGGEIQAWSISGPHTQAEAELLAVEFQSQCEANAVWH